MAKGNQVKKKGKKAAKGNRKQKRNEEKKNKNVTEGSDTKKERK